MLENAEPTEQLVPDSATQTEQTEERRSEDIGLNEQRVDRWPMDYWSHTDDDSCFGMETDTGSLEQSTLAQALFCPAEVRDLTGHNESSNESNSPDVWANSGTNPLSATSRVIIKQCFTETIPICLDPGHPVIALNQEQITSILRIVADGSARASFEILNIVVERASKLNLGSPTKLSPSADLVGSLALILIPMLAVNRQSLMALGETKPAQE